MCLEPIVGIYGKAHVEETFVLIKETIEVVSLSLSGLLKVVYAHVNQYMQKTSPVSSTVGRFSSKSLTGR